MQKGPKLKPMLQNPEVLKFGLEIMYDYEEEEIDENTYYVYWISPHGDKYDDPFKVIKEDGKWKIRSVKSWEDDPIFRKIERGFYRSEEAKN